MPVKKIITSTIPNKSVKHFFQLAETAPMLVTLTGLSRQAFFDEKVISTTKYKDNLTVRTETVWASRADCDAADQALLDQHPNYIVDRDNYNSANNIIWTTAYEEV